MFSVFFESYDCASKEGKGKRGVSWGYEQNRGEEELSTGVKSSDLRQNEFIKHENGQTPL